MEESNRGNLQPNEFPIPEDKAYAQTDIYIAEAIEFLWMDLEPVNLEDLGPDDQECAICQQDFCISEDPKVTHPPVKTVCGHIFGKPCIVRWLDPLCYWGLVEEDADREIGRIDASLVQPAKTSCPTCRNEFFPQPYREPMERLATRLWFWDKAYEFLSIARSEKEERTRYHLVNYIHYCRSINQFTHSRAQVRHFLESAKRLLLRFARSLASQPLSPIQEDLRFELEKLVDRDMDAIIMEGDGSSGRVVWNPNLFLAEWEGDEEVDENIQQEEGEQQQQAEERPDPENPEPEHPGEA